MQKVAAQPDEKPFLILHFSFCIFDRRGGLRRFFDEAGHGVARLRAFADPVLRAIQLEREIFTRLERLVGADFLDALAIARAAAVGHHNAIHRGVFRADPFHANFYRHKCFKRA